MPKKANKSKSRESNVDKQIISSHHAAAAGDVLSNSQDVSRKIPNWVLTEKPPLNFLNTIHWIQESYQGSFSLSVSGAVLDSSFAVVPSSFNAMNSIAALFDQACIYSMMIRIGLEQNTAPTLVNGSFGRLHTAIDYDTVQTITSEGNFQRYGSCQSSELVFGKSYERYVKPTVPLAAVNTGLSTVGSVMSRSWFNSANINIPHYSFRILTAGNNTAAAMTVSYTVTAVIGLRNNV